MWCCYHVWGDTYKSYLEKLFLMQKKIELLMVWDQELIQKPLFENAKIFDVFHINRYLIGKFTDNVYDINAHSLYLW